MRFETLLGGTIFYGILLGPESSHRLYEQEEASRNSLTQQRLYPSGLHSNNTSYTNPLILESTSPQRHQTCMYLLKNTTDSVQNHPCNSRMDYAYRFWTVTLSFCKGYETLQYALGPRLLACTGTLPVAHLHSRAFYKAFCTWLT